MEDVMDMMEPNSEGSMEFPRDVMIEDCFDGAEEPLYGFVTNVTIPEEMLEPCLENVECFGNGTLINATTNSQENLDIITETNSGDHTQVPLKRQGNIMTGTYIFQLACLPCVKI